jgi:drug/metabolite transporter (DMT)-like permease
VYTTTMAVEKRRARASKAEEATVTAEPASVKVSQASGAPQSPGRKGKGDECCGSFAKLMAYAGGLLVSFTLYNIELEKVYTEIPKTERVELTLNLMISTGFLYVISAFIGTKIRKEEGSKVENLGFFILASCTFISSFSSMFALNYISMPVRVLVKSCKALPIMIVGAISGEKYKLRKVLSVVFICFGTFIFTTGGGGGNSTEKSTTITGMALLALSLFFDGTVGVIEDKFMASHDVGPFTMMLNIHKWRFLISCVVVCVSPYGNVASLFAIWQKAYFPMLMLGITGACGQACIFLTINEFGALTTSVVGSTRKVISIVLSVIIFGHVLSAYQIGGLAIGCVGLVVNLIRGASWDITVDFMGTMKKILPFLSTGGSEDRSQKIDLDQLAKLDFALLNPALQANLKGQMEKHLEMKQQSQKQLKKQLLDIQEAEKHLDKELVQTSQLLSKLNVLLASQDGAEQMLRKLVPNLPKDEKILYVVTSQGQYPVLPDAVFRMTTAN